LKGNCQWHKRPEKVDTFWSRASSPPADAENMKGANPNCFGELYTSMQSIKSRRWSSFVVAWRLRRRGIFGHRGECYSSAIFKSRRRYGRDINASQMRHSELESIQWARRTLQQCQRRGECKLTGNPGEFWLRARGDDIHTVLIGALGLDKWGVEK